MSSSGSRRRSPPVTSGAAASSRRARATKKAARSKTERGRAAPAASDRGLASPRDVRRGPVARGRALTRPPTRDEIDDALRSALADGELAAWLAAEKVRRGLAAEQLVFVGTHNIAQQIWCPMQAVLKSRAEELMFFREFLEDRVHWAATALLIGRLPKSRDEWLEIGNELTLADVESLHARERADDAAEAVQLARDGLMQRHVPDASDGEMDRFTIGHAYEAQHAEVYPRVQWHFAWGPYEIIAAPDGLTDAFVYEFKTGARRHFLPESKRTAFAQADLYGVFFRRATKRVQLLVREDGITETWQEPVDEANAERVLRTFQSVVDGTLPAPPPPWKCRRCDVRARCPLVAYTPLLSFDSVPGRPARR